MIESGYSIVKTTAARPDWPLRDDDTLCRSDTFWTVWFNHKRLGRMKTATGRYGRLKQVGHPKYAKKCSELWIAQEIMKEHKAQN